jgi:glutamate-1-semialdehyde 2,1-aminomutase
MPVNTYMNPPYDGITTAGVPGWPASPDVLVARWNDIDDVDRILAAHGSEIAVVAMEPVAIDCGILPINREFLVALRERCTSNGSLMMFDEMVSGFRVAPGGAQELLDVMPDITIFGKAVACGFPIAGIGASRELFTRARAMDVRFMGTFNGHALALAAGLGALDTYEADGARIYPELEANGRLLADGLRSAAAATGAPVVVHQLGPIVTLFWGVEPPVVTYADTTRTNRSAVALLDEHLTIRGVRTLRASRWYLSAAHTPDDIGETVVVAQEAFAACVTDLENAG